jgi:hypothetical protein
MAIRKDAAPRPVLPLDTFSKRPRGRPKKVSPSEIRGRADNYRRMLEQVWDGLWLLLAQAQTEEDVIRAFDKGASPYTQQFTPALAELILDVMRESRFPHRREPRINFLADSLAARGWVRPRRSRDICANERAKQNSKSPYRIIRKEFYVECECGYKGPAHDDACRKCGAEIPLPLNIF